MTDLIKEHCTGPEDHESCVGNMRSKKLPGEVDHPSIAYIPGIA
jgi:hypothetical protein